MAANSTIRFPSPIGGVPFDLDFAPSILFAALYGVAALGAIYRLVRKESRTIVVIGTLAFVIERVVIFALRAKQAHTPSEDYSHGLTTYWQISFAAGYLSMYADLCVLMRCMFVKATLGPSGKTTPESADTDGSRAHIVGFDTPLEEDKPAERAAYRYLFGLGNLFAWIPVITGIVGGNLYPSGETSLSTANTVQALRYITAVFALVFIFVLQAMALYAVKYVPRVRKSSGITAFVMACLLNVVSVYRLIVMRNHTTSLTSLDPGSLNTTNEKVRFYVFHVAPEFLVAGAMITLNVRKRFSTGLLGDQDAKKKKGKCNKDNKRGGSEPELEPEKLKQEQAEGV